MANAKSANPAWGATERSQPSSPPRSAALRSSWRHEPCHPSSRPCARARPRPGSLPASGSYFGRSPVASSTSCLANSFGSRGRLRERSGIGPQRTMAVVRSGHGGCTMVQRLSRGGSANHLLPQRQRKPGATRRFPLVCGDGGSPTHGGIRSSQTASPPGKRPKSRGAWQEGFCGIPSSLRSTSHTSTRGFRGPERANTDTSPCGRIRRYFCRVWFHTFKWTRPLVRYSRGSDDVHALDKASNNVLGEFDAFAEADAFRIQTVGYNPDLAEHVVVVDLEQSLAAPEPGSATSSRRRLASLRQTARPAKRAYARPVRQRLVKYWWVWLTIAVIAVVGNEFFDRDVAGDKKGHPFGDFLVAIVLVGIVFYASRFVARRRSRQTP